MDRDRRWDRTKLAYDAIVHAEGPRAAGAVEAVEASYARGETDEFVRPTVIGDYDGMADGDVAIHFNFRPDRARQLVQALAEPGIRRVRPRQGPRDPPHRPDRVPRGLGLPGGVPARVPARRWPR